MILYFVLANISIRFEELNLRIIKNNFQMKNNFSSLNLQTTHNESTQFSFHSLKCLFFLNISPIKHSTTSINHLFDSKISRHNSGLVFTTISCIQICYFSSFTANSVTCLLIISFNINVVILFIVF